MGGVTAVSSMLIVVGPLPCRDSGIIKCEAIPAETDDRKSPPALELGARGIGACGSIALCFGVCLALGFLGACCWVHFFALRAWLE